MTPRALAFVAAAVAVGFFLRRRAATGASGASPRSSYAKLNGACEPAVLACTDCRNQENLRRFRWPDCSIELMEKSHAEYLAQCARSAQRSRPRQRTGYVPVMTYQTRRRLQRRRRSHEAREVFAGRATSETS